MEEDEIALSDSLSDSEGDDGKVSEEEVRVDELADGLEQTQIDDSRPIPSPAEEKKKKRRNKDDKKQRTAKEENLWKCNVCSVIFDTRNKLFSHIRETGHALAVPDHQAAKKGRNKRK